MEIVKQNATLETPIDTEWTMKHIEKAARTCYQSYDKAGEGSAERLIRSCIKRGHESIIEHVSVSFRIVCDRGVLAEITRHRLASYSVESTRYVNYRKGITVIAPPELSAEQRALWEKACISAEDTYRTLIEDGVSPQIARSILPTCLKTELIMTANLREWRHFIKLRNSTAAHPQIRDIASKILDILAEKLPAVFDDLR